MASKATQLEKLGWKLLGQNLGRGGQGDVELAKRVTDPGGPTYAVKLLSSNRGGSKARDRFRHELKALTSVDHPGIVKVIEYAQNDAEVQYYVMEYIAGAKSLRQRMDQNSNPFFRNPLKAVNAFLQIVEALSACEKRNIVHRDLSPANVLVTDDERVLLIDFGLCHIEGSQVITLTEEAVGTPHYRPPECSGYFHGDPTVGADLYSAAKILWSMITNKPAFDRENPVFNQLALAVELPDVPMSWHLHHIFEGTIRRDPTMRFRTTEEALAATRQVRRLIVDGFRPLEVLAGHTCPICGIGRLGQTNTLPQPYQEDLGVFYSNIGRLHELCEICPYCFRVTFVLRSPLQRVLRERKQLE